ncbi:MAG: DUF362 domain-containing protein [candidate division Zixibacteria bacterium]|nr:DUF362 domain-containing protein [candidate division Zixibacteria bacterium]
MSNKHATVGLGVGANRRANVRAALEHVRDDLVAAVRDVVMLKPNFLSASNPLVCTHADAIRGALDVLSELPHRPKEILIAEGGNEAYSGEAFRFFGYLDLPEEYDIPIRLVDLNTETRWHGTRVYMIDGSHRVVKMPKTVLECPCVISMAVAKTHDGAMVTLALKNLIMGTLRKKDRIKIHGFLHHSERRHPSEARALSRNLIRVARHLYPHFSVIDGTVGIQGNGPGGTDTVALKLAAASADTVAVDAVIAKLMGFEPLDVGTIFYGDAIGLGVGDIERINVLGGDLETLALPFKPHDSIDLQRQWRIPGVWEMAATE